MVNGVDSKFETQEHMGMEDTEQEEEAGAQAENEEKEGRAAEGIVLPQVASPTLPELQPEHLQTTSKYDGKLSPKNGYCPNTSTITR